MLAPWWSSSWSPTEFAADRQSRLTAQDSWRSGSILEFLANTEPAENGESVESEPDAAASAPSDGASDSHLRAWNYKRNERWDLGCICDLNSCSGDRHISHDARDRPHGPVGFQHSRLAEGIAKFLVTLVHQEAASNESSREHVRCTSSNSP